VERGSVEVSEIVDHARFGPCALTVSVLTTLALVFDGFDIQAIAFAAPRLMSEWNMDRAALAPILAAGLLGMFVGALMLGIAGDRYGPESWRNHGGSCSDPETFEKNRGGHSSPTKHDVA